MAASSERRIVGCAMILFVVISLAVPAAARDVRQDRVEAAPPSAGTEIDRLVPGRPVLTRKAPYLIYTGSNAEMQVLWQLYSAAQCTLSWGPDTTYSLGSVVTTQYGPSHQHTYTIPDLVPGDFYHYRVVAGDETHTGTFHAGLPAAATELDFMAYGDTRSYPADHDDVAGAMVSEYAADPDFQSFTLVVGDLVNSGDSETDWDTQFFDPSYTGIQDLLRNAPYLSAIGNHEGTGVLFQKFFPYPFEEARYWSFDYGPAHFVMVDQYTAYGSGSTQLQWIEDDLASTGKPWKFMCLHEPGWSAGHHGNNTDVQVFLQPLCEQYGVPIVFGGHNHYYSRAVVNGVHHITTGGGGAPLYAPNPDYPYIVSAAQAHHYCRISIDGTSLDFEAVTPAGAVIDSFSLDLGWVGVESPEEATDRIALYPPRPNPSGPGTRLSFSLPEAADVRLVVYNASGQKIATVADGAFGPGLHDVVWDGTDRSGAPVSSGVYFCLLRAGEQRVTGKLVLTE